MAAATGETELIIIHQQPSQDIESGGTVVEPVLPEEAVLSGGLFKPLPETTTRERITGGIGAFAVLTALMAILIEPSTIVILAGLLSSILGLSMYYQETRLTDITTLQKTKMAIQAEANRLIQSIQALIKNVDDLTHTVDRLQEIEQALLVLNDKSGRSLDEFAKQVGANKELLRKMKGNLKGCVLQNLLSVILRSDTDGDFVIHEAEVKDLIRRISNISGVRVDKVKFQNACQGKSIHAVMEMVKNLFRPDILENDRIFIFDD